MKLKGKNAMITANANTTAITALINDLKRGTPIFEAIEKTNLHSGIKEFLNFTFKTIEGGKAHEIAAAFTFGREDLIPSMFTEILKGFQQNFPETDLTKLVYYFERHIELDGDEHGPMAMKMISELCGDDQHKWNDVVIVSKEALVKRYNLWNSIEKFIDKK